MKGWIFDRRNEASYAKLKGELETYL